MAIDRDRMNILLVEDHSSIVGRIRDLLDASNIRCRLQTVGVGDNTLSYLRQSGPYADAPRPDLILFDCSDITPASLQLLDQIKADRDIGVIPVVLIIDAEAEGLLQKMCADRGDRTMFAPIGLDCFFKAMNSFRLDRFLNAVKLIESCGFVLVSLPEAKPAGSVDNAVSNGSSARMRTA